MKTLSIALLVLCFLIPSSAVATCVTNSWNGGTGYWDDALLWSADTVPTICDTVVVATGNDYVNVADPNKGFFDAVAGSLQLGNSTSGNSTLFFDGARLTVAQDFSISRYGHVLGNANVDVGGNLRNAGEFVGSASVAGHLLNSGTWGSLTIGDYGLTAGSLENSGKFLMIGGSFNIAGNLINSGDLEAPDGVDPPLLNIGGTLLNQSGGTILLATRGVTVPTIQNFGDLFFQGNVQTTTIENHGAFGLATGTVTVASVDNFGGVSVAGINHSLMDVSGNFRNFGSMTVGYCCDTENTWAGTLKVHGALTSSDTIQMNSNMGNGNTLVEAGSLDNSGLIEFITPGAQLLVHGHAENSGVIRANLNADFFSSSSMMADSLTNTSTGSIALNAAASSLTTRVLDNRGAISVNFNTIQCDGLCQGAMVRAGTLINSGTINVVTTSQLTVGGGGVSIFGDENVPCCGYYQLADGTLGEAISAAGFGIITVADGASLDGTLRILLDPNFNPAVGSTYKFLLFAPSGLTGQFAAVENRFFNHGTEMWQVLYDNADGWVALEAAASTTPEPSTLLLLGSGILGGAYGVRRRLGRP